MFFLFFLFNLVFYFFSLKFFFIIFKDKYIFPIRVAEYINYIFNIILFAFFTYFIFGIEFIFQILMINTCIAFSFFCILSMINTSPRTKILLDLKKKKFKIKNYLNFYNYRKLLDNRIKRLKSNNEIIFKNGYVEINKEKNFKFLTLIIFLFNILKKI